MRARPLLLGLNLLPPIGAADSYTTPYETRLDVDKPGVLANDTDLDSSELFAELVSGTSHGVLELREEGRIRYEPDNGFSGTDKFTYRPYDGTFYALLAVTVTITVKPRPPATPTPKPTATPTPDTDPDADSDADTARPTPTPTPTPTLRGRRFPLPTLPLPTLPAADDRTSGPPDPDADPDPASGSGSDADPDPDCGRRSAPARRRLRRPAPTPRPVRRASPRPSASSGAGARSPPVRPAMAAARPSARSERGAGRAGGRTSTSVGPIAFGSFGTVGLGIEWVVPTVLLTVPGFLLLVIGLAQVFGGLVWLPLVRRWLRGDGRPMETAGGPTPH